MRLSVGQMASLLGVSQSTVRRYDKYGFQIGRRDQNNQYRYYSLSDALKLATYINIKSQFFSPVEITNTSREISLAQLVHETENKLLAIDRRIAELNATRYCWEKQLWLVRILEKLNREEMPFEYIDYPALVIDPMGKSADLKRDSLYFALFREKSMTMHLCRMCTVWDTASNRDDAYFQAVSFFQDHIPTELLQRFPQCIIIPAQRYIAIPSLYGGIIDDALPPDILAERIGHIREKMRLFHQHSSLKLYAPSFAMSVQIKSDSNPSLILIPVESE